MKLPVRRTDLRVPGFLFSGVACGLKDDGRKDVAMIFAPKPAAAAGAFTTNRFAAPPVLIARRRLRSGLVQAVLVNTKSANAGTGASGRRRAEQCCQLAATLLGTPERRVVPCSTGQIGLPLPWGKMSRGIRLAVLKLSTAGLWDAAEEVRLDSDQMARLLRALWFDERTLALRAQSPRRPAAASQAAAAL